MLNPKPKIKLVGEDGNAYAILGRAHRSLKNAGATPEQIEEFMKEAQSSDYDNLLRTCMDWFEHDSDEEEE
jgi:hypothetical protein